MDFYCMDFHFSFSQLSDIWVVTSFGNYEKKTINICCSVSYEHKFLFHLDIYLRVILLGNMGSVYLTLEKIASHLFRSGCTVFAFPLAISNSSNYSLCLLALSIFSLISICVCLMTSDVLSIFSCFYLPFICLLW